MRDEAATPPVRRGYLVNAARFDAALLLVVMLILNAWAAGNLVPAWIVRFRPGFIVRAKPHLEEEESAALPAGA